MYDSLGIPALHCTSCAQTRTHDIFVFGALLIFSQPRSIIEVFSYYKKIVFRDLRKTHSDRMSQLPNTLTPADVTLTPETEALITNPKLVWGRLFPTLKCLSAYDLQNPTFKLGKTEGCDCVLTNETFIGRKLDNISREHFVISREAGKPVIITDLSKNGTFLNGDRIGRKKTRILQNDDEISIGFQGLKVFIYKNLECDRDNFLPLCLQRKYLASRFLGRGACGEVRLIFDKQNCTPYAVKKIIKSKSRTSAMNYVDAIKKEIKILRSLDHPLIVSTFDVEETPDAFFIIMEYMEGGQLTDLISTTRLSEEQVKYLFYQIVNAVQYLHDNGIIHRDLKADNILLKERDNPRTVIKVSDFGLSKILEEESQAKTKCGTPYYIAPEILDPSKAYYDRKVDIWSLGVMLYYMLSQTLPFRANDTKVLLKQILNRKFDMNEPVWKNKSTEVKDLINRMLTISPDSRINLEEIPDHPWIETDKLIQERVEDVLYGEGVTYVFEINESTIEQDCKRMKFDDDPN